MINNDALPDSLRIRQKLTEPDGNRCVRDIPERCLVKTIDFVASLLKFDREEIGGADADTLCFNALCIVAAGRNFVSPEAQAAGVRLTIEEVEVVLADEEFDAVNRVRTGGGLQRLPGRTIILSCRCVGELCISGTVNILYVNFNILTVRHVEGDLPTVRRPSWIIPIIWIRVASVKDPNIRAVAVCNA